MFIFTISIFIINFIISICYFVAKTLIFKSGLIPNNIIIKIIVKITMKISIISHFALIIHKQILPLSNHKCLYAQAAYAHYNKEAGGIPGGSSRFLIIGIFSSPVRDFLIPREGIIPLPILANSCKNWKKLQSSPKFPHYNFDNSISLPIFANANDSFS